MDDYRTSKILDIINHSVGVTLIEISVKTDIPVAEVVPLLNNLVEEERVWWRDGERGQVYF